MRVMLRRFVSNNNTPMLTRSLHEAASSAWQHEAPLGALHPITLKSYYKVRRLARCRAVYLGRAAPNAADVTTCARTSTIIH